MFIFAAVGRLLQNLLVVALFAVLGAASLAAYGVTMLAQFEPFGAHRSSVGAANAT